VRQMEPADRLRSQLRASLRRWERVLTGNRAEARALLEVVLSGRIAFEPVSSGGYVLRVPVAFDKILMAAVPAAGVLQDCGVTRAGIEPAAL
jgi:hypothetical protein